MIELREGNLIDADVEALVNPVNTHGVMGKGLALLFKNAYPEMVAAYEQDCRDGRISIGHVQVFDRHTLINPRFIINFPTKRHWREHSKLEYITEGLNSLVTVVKELKIRSIAVPALGCGYGGLTWNEVHPELRKALERLANVQVLIFTPHGVEESASQHKTEPTVIMTPSRASVIQVLARYTALGNDLTLLEIHKLLYFLQEAGEPLRLRYKADFYGPYADNLQYVLRVFEGTITSGFKQGGSKPDLPIELLPAAVQASSDFMTENGLGDEADRRLERVSTLIEGFESCYGLELLATVHYTIMHNAISANDRSAVVRAVHAWNERKHRLLQPQHIQIALDRLSAQKWLTAVDAPADSGQTPTGSNVAKAA